METLQTQHHFDQVQAALDRERDYLYSRAIVRGETGRDVEKCRVNIALLKDELRRMSAERGNHATDR